MRLADQAGTQHNRRRRPLTNRARAPKIVRTRFNWIKKHVISRKKNPARTFVGKKEKKTNGHRAMLYKGTIPKGIRRVLEDDYENIAVVLPTLCKKKATKIPMNAGFMQPKSSQEKKGRK